MCRITSCGVCCDLRIGVYLVAAYTITVGLIGSIVAGVGAGSLTAGKRVMGTGNDTDGQDGWMTNTRLTMFEGIFYMNMVVYALWVVSAVPLIIGITMSKRGYFTPWIVITVILTTLTAFAILCGLLNVHGTFTSTMTTINFVLQVALFVLNCFSLSAVTSFYKDNCMDRNAVIKLSAEILAA